jgi:hypothetical protein
MVAMAYDVLVIGFDPARIPGMDAAASAPAFAEAQRRADERDVALVECLIAPDDSAVAQIQEALRGRRWDCVVIGGGIRKPEPALELFEFVVNLVHSSAPDAAIAFNTSPADSVEAALRAIASREGFGPSDPG